MKKKKSKSKNLVLFTLVFLAIMISLFILNKATDKSSGNIAFDNQPTLENQPVLGKSDAKVSIVEFGDYKCPACKAWGEQIFPRLTKDYIDTGKVKFSYRNVTFHGEESMLASIAAESVFAQDPQAYWTFHKEVFKAQPPEQSHDDAWITTEKLLGIAKSYIPQIDLQKLEEDIKNQTTLPQVNQDISLGEEFNVQNTPSIIVNGTMVADPFNYDNLVAIIEQGLGGE